VLIYRLQNRVNGKTYIGQHTGFWIETRWNKALSSRNKANPHLAAAIKKYGPENFTRTILCYATCQEELNLLEQFFIAAYQSANKKFGYNKMLGGQYTARIFTKEVRAAISKSGRKAWKRGAHRKHSEAVKRWWRNLSEAERRLQKLKISLATRGRSTPYPPPWNKGMKGQGAGRPSARKGKKYGPNKSPSHPYPPFTRIHKKRISEALLRYHRERRKEKRGRPKKGRKR
jgi:group I intron endonuclease